MTVDRIPVPQPPDPLGARLSDLRKAAGLTLTQVSQACGMSEATLSRIENGHSQVSAHHLFLLAQVLGVDIAEMFHDTSAPLTKGMRSITRNNAGEHHELERYTAEVLNADISRKTMHPAINTITARTLDEAGGLTAHAGEEFLYVLRGTVAVHSELYAPAVLKAGDCLYFDGSMAHAYLQGGADPAVILVVVGPGGSR